MKKSLGLVHVMFECKDCGKIFDNYINGQALAAKHAKSKKHIVKGEIVIMVIYDGKNGK